MHMPCNGESRTKKSSQVFSFPATASFLPISNRCIETKKRRRRRRPRFPSHLLPPPLSLPATMASLPPLSLPVSVFPYSSASDATKKIFPLPTLPPPPYHHLLLLLLNFTYKQASKQVARLLFPSPFSFLPTDAERRGGVFPSFSAFLSFPSRAPFSTSSKNNLFAPAGLSSPPPPPPSPSSTFFSLEMRVFKKGKKRRERKGEKKSEEGERD